MPPKNLILKQFLPGSPVENLINKIGNIKTQQLINIVNGKNTTAAEKHYITAALNAMGNPSSVNYLDFKNKLSSLIPELNKTIGGHSKAWNGSNFDAYGLGSIGFNVNLTDEAKLRSKDGENFWDFNYDKNEIQPRTYLFHNENAYGLGSANHFDPSTLMHSRIFTVPSEPEVLYVPEAQSDWFQSGDIIFFPRKGMDKSGYATPWEYYDSIMKKANDLPNTPSGNIERKWLIGGDFNNQYARAVEEKKYWDIKNMLGDYWEPRLALENAFIGNDLGATVMRYPTRDTAALLQGFKKISPKYSVDDFGVARVDGIKDLVPKSEWDTYMKKKRIMDGQTDDYIAGNDDIFVDENWNPITFDKIVEKYNNYIKDLYDKYNIEHYHKSHVPILNRYNNIPSIMKQAGLGNPTIVTDPRGHTWYQVNIPENMKEMQFRGLKQGGILKRI